jgi:TolA-binding protein
MSELEPLATELRGELGAPPESWLKDQRARFRKALREPGLRPKRRPVLLLAAALSVALGLGAWAILPKLGSPAVEDKWLVFGEPSAPHRFEDGSSIALGPGGRGRLLVREDAVRFDLHAGRATFEVVPKQPRPWIVSAGKNEVRVVGTRFSVLYGSGEAFEVEVERGVVSVRVPDRSSSIQLEAGDRLRGRPGQIALLHGGATEPPPSEPVAPTLRTAPPAKAGSASVVPSGSSASPAPDDWRESYRQGDYAASLARARSIGVDKLIAELPPKSLAELADAARLGGDPALAVRALTALQRRFPSSPEAREAKFLLGRVHALRGDTKAAIASFESYLAQRGASPYTTEAIGRLMELHSGRGDTERARAMAERYLERAPNGPYKRLATSLVEQPR